MGTLIPSNLQNLRADLAYELRTVNDNHSSGWKHPTLRGPYGVQTSPHAKMINILAPLLLIGTDSDRMVQEHSVECFTMLDHV